MGGGKVELGGGKERGFKKKGYPTKKEELVREKKTEINLKAGNQG